jgi:hypothetical protein
MLSTYEYIHGTKDQSGRWQGVNRRYATEPRYVHLTGVIKYHFTPSHLVLMQEIAVKVNKMQRS